ncbi:MAG: GspE/PulE family protein, partial [Planctomycetes bacterium]|nr:GspE/PulE family protein [Planctomycetota bacterium]
MSKKKMGNGSQKKKPEENDDYSEMDSELSEFNQLIDMDAAIEMLKTSRTTFYRWLRAGKIKGMKLGRQWRFYQEDIKRFLKGESPKVELRADIAPLVKVLTKRIEKLGAKDPSKADVDELQRTVNLMILLGVLMRASDIHIAPHLNDSGNETVSTIRFRIDGILHTIAEFDNRLLQPIIEKWKTMAACDINEEIRPQDGRILIELSEQVENQNLSGKRVDIRVSFLLSGLGESLTARILDSSSISLGLDKIEYSKTGMQKLKNSIHAPWGLVVVTGPTGSGKTTVLYSCLNEITNPKIKTMTVEDPIEYFLPLAIQTSVNQKAGITFTSALRSVLRSDPDVILVGEIRNLESLQLAMQCALTGHLVLTALHANDAATALFRMVKIGVDSFVIADAVKLILSQRLIRKLCPYCSEEKMPNKSKLEIIKSYAKTQNFDWDSIDKKFREPVGCPKCAFGFKGRTVAAEMLEVTSKIGEALRNGAE